MDAMTSLASEMRAHQDFYTNKQDASYHLSRVYGELAQMRLAVMSLETIDLVKDAELFDLQEEIKGIKLTVDKMQMVFK
jgi:hypothetical protein